MSKHKKSDRESIANSAAHSRHAENYADMTPTEVAQLVHELETRKIELARQNDELRKAQLEVVELRNHYAELYHAAPIGLVSTNELDLIVQVNQTLATMLGFTTAELADKPLSTYVPPQDGDAYSQYRMAVLDQPVSSGCEIRLCKKDGSLLWVRLDSVFDDQDEADHRLVRSIISDITARKEATILAARLQREMLHKDKLQAIGELSGGIAHEFNNLLTPILGYLELFLLGKTSAHPDYKNICLIQNAANRAKDLVQQLLAFSHPATENQEPMLLEPCLEEVIAMARHTIPANVSLSLRLERSLPPVSGNSGALSQAILNLILNACHAMPGGGVLTIELTDAGVRAIPCAVEPGATRQFLCVTVEDTGTGMSAESIKHIFDPFITTKGTGMGTGLGLSMVHGIIALHEGHINVESTPGQGSVFRVYLPTCAASLQPKVESDRTQTKRTGSILFVDDEPMVVSLGKSMMEQLGYTVQSYLCSATAEKYCAEHLSDVDLLITDYKMPEIDGIQLSQKIKNLNPAIPVLLLTGQVEEIT